MGSDGVGKSDPNGLLVSLMLPSQDARQGISKVEDIWLVFCHQVRFFTSPGEIDEWVAARPGLEVAQLTLEETAELAAIAWADLRSYAR